MTHNHNINDVDPHFVVDPITRVILDKSTTKTSLMQYDHNSERLTFEIPRYVDEHDMSECNKVEIHYINIGTNNKRVNGIYEVSDLKVDPKNEDQVICSWLISSNATSLVGNLSFVLRFMCITNENDIDYVWNTCVYSGIPVANGINNTGAIVSEHADILRQWYDDFVPLLEKEIEDEKQEAIATIVVQADEIVNLVLDRLPRAEEASF